MKNLAGEGVRKIAGQAVYIRDRAGPPLAKPRDMLESPH